MILQVRNLTVEEIIAKYSYAEGYLCYRILMDEIKDLLPSFEMKDPVNRMISQKKVMSDFTFHATRVFLTYNYTKHISKEEFLGALKDKFGKEMVTYLIVEEVKAGNDHTHMYLTFCKRKRVSRESFFDLSFVTNGQLETKSAYIQNVYNDSVAVVNYVKKWDKNPLTNMLLENGRVIKKRQEKIDYLCRNKKSEEVWDYINNDSEFEADITTRNENLYKEIDSKISFYQNRNKNESDQSKKLLAFSEHQTVRRWMGEGDKSLFISHYPKDQEILVKGCKEMLSLSKRSVDEVKVVHSLGDISESAVYQKLIFPYWDVFSKEDKMSLLDTEHEVSFLTEMGSYTSLRGNRIQCILSSNVDIFEHNWIKEHTYLIDAKKEKKLINIINVTINNETINNHINNGTINNINNSTINNIN
jgi:hypothetical protein